MNNFTGHFKETLIDRANIIVNDIATTDPKYKQLTKEIVQLVNGLINQLSSKFRLFDDYRDLVLQQDTLVVKPFYLQCFACHQ